MKYRGGELTTEDLPRLEENLKRIQSIVRQLRKEAGTKATKPDKVTAEQFWSLHAQAVAAISQVQTNPRDVTWVQRRVTDHRCAVKSRDFDRAAQIRRDLARILATFRENREYGDYWKVRAGADETILARLPADICKASTVTHKGKYSWGGHWRDQRLPAAQFWPGGQLPAVAMAVAGPPKPFTPWVVYNGVEMHPMLASLSSFLAEERQQKRESQEIREIHVTMNLASYARQKARDAALHGIREYAEKLDYWDDDHRVEWRMAA